MIQKIINNNIKVFDFTPKSRKPNQSDSTVPESDFKTQFLLFGAPSSADSLYMDVRLADLPSGLGKVIVPNKVYVNRAR